MATTYTNIGTTTGGAGASTTDLNVAFNLTGNNPGQSVDVQLFNPNSPAVVQVLNLVSGATTINATNCPALANAGGVVLIPPVGNTQAITLKGASGDTGIALSKVAPTMIAFDVAPPTSFVLTTGGAITGFKLAWV